jgi:hypothetical protein
LSKQVWTAEAILEKIRLLNQSGEDLRHGVVYPENKRLISAAVRHFGSWRAAVAAAGVDYREIRQMAEQSRAEKIRKWSNEMIIEGIKEMVVEGEPIAAASARRARPALFSAAVSERYFGSWRAAVTAAGVDYDAILETSKSSTHRADSRRRRSILNKIRTLDRDVLLLPAEQVAMRYPNLFSLATEHFESWQQAVEEAMVRRRLGQ